MRRPRNQNVPSAHPLNPPTRPSDPIANCVHARANQIGPFELFGLLQLGHCPTHGVAIKSRSALVLSRARPRSQSPSPDTPTRLGPTFLKARRIAVNIGKLPEPLPSRGTRNQLSVSKKQDFVRRTVSRVLVGAKIMEAMVDVLIISALIPDYWPLLAGLTMAAVLALV